ncbi:glycosyltransferase [Mesosutterella sp. AGMB02718]|uniref:Glycosyltransferase n=1 Tax=Mesosutterella faecium TaxID=2925194 RepID=A0ABT7IMZ9_9BURK|nr:glycosyltransferase family 2 protein [Mesosutterella sp. AGMB02718]MDL2059757.1 glycosyltransferase [Mesosutterella sp. AGMB02718]
MMKEAPEFRPAVVIPCYNHGATLGRVLDAVSRLGLPCLVVDDGSDGGNRRLIDEAVSSRPFCSLERRTENGGKGAAVMQGVEALAARGFTHALQVDADLQHNLADAPLLLERARRRPEALISGLPVYDESAPLGRRIGRTVTQFWVRLETLSADIRDSMCGFRVYPVGPFMRVIRAGRPGGRMDFDIEILVRLHWAGVPMEFVPTRVVYPEGGVSHFDYLRDNLRISAMHTKLMLEAPAHWLSSLRRGRRASGGWEAAPERHGAPGIRILLWIYRRFGRGVFRAVLRPVVFFYWATGTEGRRESGRYLRLVRGFAGARGAVLSTGEPLTSYRHFLHFGEALLDRILAWNGEFSLSRDIVLDQGSDRALTVRAGARGKLLLTSHYGVPEVCRALAWRDAGTPVTVVLFEGNAQAFRKELEKEAGLSRLTVISAADFGLGTAAELEGRIRRGEWVAMAADRLPAGAARARKERFIRVPFLGRPACFPAGPYILASLLDCEVDTLFACREGHRFRVSCAKLADRVSLPRLEREQALKRLAEAFASRLEEQVLRQPLEWFNFYDFWAEPRRKSPEPMADLGRPLQK